MDDRQPVQQSTAWVTPRTGDTAGLWFLAVTLGAAIFVMAVSGRWKPILAFPVVTGCVLAGLGHWLRAVLETAANRGQAVFMSLLAATATLAAFAAAAGQQPLLKLPENPLAKQLLEVVERESLSDSGETAWSRRFAVWNRYVAARYTTHSPVQNSLAAFGEALFAAVVAAVVIRSRRVAHWFHRGVTK